jgi:hypothetical protein
LWWGTILGALPPSADLMTRRAYYRLAHEEARRRARGAA